MFVLSSLQMGILVFIEFESLLVFMFFFFSYFQMGIFLYFTIQFPFCCCYYQAASIRGVPLFLFLQIFHFYAFA